MGDKYKAFLERQRTKRGISSLTSRIVVWELMTEYQQII